MAPPAVTEEFIPSEALRILEINFMKHRTDPALRLEVSFQYGKGCARSKYPADITKGILLLSEVSHEGFRVTECQYWSAWGLMKLGSHDEAFKIVEKILSRLPEHTEALDLRRNIRRKIVSRNVKRGILLFGAALIVLYAAKVWSERKSS